MAGVVAGVGRLWDCAMMLADVSGMAALCLGTPAAGTVSCGSSWRNMTIAMAIANRQAARIVQLCFITMGLLGFRDQEAAVRGL